MSEASWTVAEAKARFSEVMAKAASDGPQTVTRRGQTAVVIVSAEEWKRRSRRTGTLADFFAASPLRGSGLSVDRMSGKPRPTDL